jgi:hypothetical protein
MRAPRQTLTAPGRQRMPKPSREWPAFVSDGAGRSLYITEERWHHALDHPGMHEGLFDVVLQTIRFGRRKQDAYDPAKYRYERAFQNLPGNYTHLVVVVKFGVTRDEPIRENNFVLTAYLVERWT